MRLDVYAAKEWPEQSRSTWQKLIQSGCVTVNGAVEVSIKRDVTDADVVDATQPENQITKTKSYRLSMKTTQ